MDISDIKVNEDVPTDKKFLEIFKKVVLNELPFYFAQIKKDGIKPFSSYKPTPSSAYTHNMLKKIKSVQPPQIHVYQEEEFFIMSDDYSSFYTYLELGIEIIPCIVLGREPIGEHVVDMSQADFSYEMSLEIISEPTKN